MPLRNSSYWKKSLPQISSHSSVSDRNRLRRRRSNSNFANSSTSPNAGNIARLKPISQAMYCLATVFELGSTAGPPLGASRCKIEGPAITRIEYCFGANPSVPIRAYAFASACFLRSASRLVSAVDFAFDLSFCWDIEESIIWVSDTPAELVPPVAPTSFAWVVTWTGTLIMKGIVFGTIPLGEMPTGVILVFTWT